ncbi:MAG TPA: hydroxymethylbilane synthase [Sedimentisphaerales bacterium]|nr:hydroxymethylbilane synthase [Sedimentisphaerales bacterium]
MKDFFTVATRPGRLAAVQTQIVIRALKKVYPHITIKIREITTAGDKDRRTALWSLKTSGFFTSQVEQALLAGRADFAVHSFKDLPTAPRPELAIAAVCQRHFAEDCIIAAEPVASLDLLKKSAVTGTSSPRRAALLRNLRKDLQIVPVRGNVTTRLKLVTDRKIDAVILARAGLERLGLAHKISFTLDPDRFIPAAAQGALVVQTRTGDTDTTAVIAAIDDKTIRTTTFAERQVLITTECGCHGPVGAFAQVSGSRINIRAFVSDLQGENLIVKTITGPASKALELAEKLAIELLEAGGKEILDKVKETRKQEPI